MVAMAEALHLAVLARLSPFTRAAPDSLRVVAEVAEVAETPTLAEAVPMA